VYIISLFRRESISGSRRRSGRSDFRFWPRARLTDAGHDEPGGVRVAGHAQLVKRLTLVAVPSAAIRSNAGVVRVRSRKTPELPSP